MKLRHLWAGLFFILMLGLAVCWPQRFHTWSWLELTQEPELPSLQLDKSEAPKGTYFQQLLQQQDRFSPSGLWLRWAKGRQGSLFFSIDDVRGAPSKAVLQLLEILKPREENSENWERELSYLRAKAPEGEWGQIESVAASLMTASSRLQQEDFLNWFAPIPSVEVLQKAAAWIQRHPEALYSQCELHRRTPSPLMPRLYERLQKRGDSAYAQALSLSRQHPETYLRWLSDGREVRADWQQTLWLKTAFEFPQCFSAFIHPLGKWVPLALIFNGFLFFFVFGTSKETQQSKSILLAALALYVGLIIVMEVQSLPQAPPLTLQWEQAEIQKPPPPQSQPEIQVSPMPKELDSLSLQLMLAFLILQVIVLILSCLSIQKNKKNTSRPEVRLRLLENDEHLYDLGLYIGLGGTVCSLIFILLGQNQQGMMAAYTSTLFGILEVALFKVLILRPYRHQLILQS
jgi:hypothetical protein